MLNKKNTLAFFLFLFACLSINGFANSLHAHQTADRYTETSSHVISQSSPSRNNESLISIHGILETLIKTNEHNGLNFQNFKTKKSFSQHSVLGSSIFSKSWYAYYKFNRIINSSPLYIAYHRLLI